MPKRQQPDPLVSRIGQRFHALRHERGYSLQRLTKQAAGFVSQFEHGTALPSVVMLDRLARSLGIELVDIINLPERGLRNQLLEATRGLSTPRLRQLLALAYCDEQAPLPLPLPVFSDEVHRKVSRPTQAMRRRKKNE